MPSKVTNLMPFIIGYDVKPNSISSIGNVTFTDGANDLTPNQIQCEAYGYTYNKADGTCSSFRYNSEIESTFLNLSNKTFGARNTTETGTTNTLIVGENNNVSGQSRNSIITGNKNQIANGINNALVSGTLGEATADNSTVLGANNSTDSLGERQAIRVLYGKQTTSAATLSANLNNTAASYFLIPDNTIVYFNATCIAVRVGGTNTGNNGDYLSLIERGVVINKSGTTTIQRERDVIKSSGTITGWNATAAVVGNAFTISVRGRNSVTLEWVCNIELTQLKTGIAL